MLPTFVAPELEVRESSIHGKGVWAKGDFRVKELLVRFGGILIRHPSEITTEVDMSTLIAIDEMAWLADMKGSDKAASEYLNHSCSPNSWMNGMLELTASRPIRAGEEITVDYAVWLDNPHYVSFGPCRCGSLRCRSVVGGEDWKRLDVIASNYGHFMPFLNARIERELEHVIKIRSRSA